MKKIKLSQGKYALCDDSDYEELIKHKWHAKKQRNTFYAARCAMTNGKQMTIRMHNQILGLKGVDHCSGDGLDNRRYNLRPATNSQNQANLYKRNNNTSSKFKGVYWHKRDKYWVSRINKKNKRIQLGYFENEIEAAKAYNTAAIELFGNFARINQIGEKTQ